MVSNDWSVASQMSAHTLRGERDGNAARERPVGIPLFSAGNFRSALAARNAIGQAKGIIRARFDISAVEAFELLQQLSQESNTKLVDVALRIAEPRVLNETGRRRKG